MPTVVSGTGDEALSLAIREHFNPGDRLTVSIPVSGNVSQAALGQISSELASRGIEVRNVSMYGNSLDISFINPGSVTGYSLAWLPIFVVLGVIGVIAIGTWTVSTVVSSISENIVPLTIVIGGLALLYLALRKKGLVR